MRWTRGLIGALVWTTLGCGGDDPFQPREPTEDDPPDPPLCSSYVVPTGDWTRLTRAQAACLEFGPGTWVVAMADTSHIAAARAGEELRPGDAVVWVGTGAGPAGTPTGVSAATPHHGVSPLRVPESCGPDDPSVFCRDRPWTEGETIILQGQEQRVFLVVDRLVFVAPTELLATREDDLSGQMGVYAERATETVIPFFRDVLVDAWIPTTVEAAQTLVWVRDQVQSATTSGVDPVDGAVGAVIFGLRSPEPELTFYHELSHVWQAGTMAEVAAAAGGIDALPEERGWSKEGGAELLGTEAIRLVYGLGFELDMPPIGSDLLDTPGLGAYWDGLHGNTGAVPKGYASAASFQRHLVQSLEVAGRSRNEAIGEVVRGGVWGWFGNAQVQGITGRMAGVLGSFDPVESLLTWSLAQGLDDRATLPAFQVPELLETWRSSAGWPPRRGMDRRNAYGDTWPVPVGGATYVLVEVGSGRSLLVPFDPGPESIVWAAARREF